YEHLGDAYAASCETYKAVVAYHEALSGYWLLGYRELATDLLSRIAQLGQEVPADWFDRWRKSLGQTIELSASGNEGCLVATKPAGPKPKGPKAKDPKPEGPKPEGLHVDNFGSQEREVYFSFDKDVFDKDKLKQEGDTTLNEVKELFRNSGREIEIRIEGYT